MIDRFASEGLKKAYLPKLSTMEYFASCCLTEPSSGSRRWLRCAPKPCATVITTSSTAPRPSSPAAAASDVTYVCMVRTGVDGPKGITCLIVDKGAKGLSFGAQEKKLGWNSQPTAMVIFEDCRVPVSNRIGDEGQGFKIAMSGSRWRAHQYRRVLAGGARSASPRRGDAAYVQTRSQFGQTIGSFQTVQFKLADMATELEAARLMVLAAAAKLDAKEPDATLYCAMAKRFATDAGFRHLRRGLATSRRLRLSQGIIRWNAFCATPASTKSSKGPTRSCA